MSTVAPPTARWNLSALFANPDDPRIEATWSEGHARADAFAARYRGRIDREDLDPATLLAGLRELESLIQHASKPVEYAGLIFAADVSNPEIGAFYQEQMEKASELRVKIMFFELELQSAPQTAIERCLADDALANYRHYVQVARKYAPYRLSEKEEVLLEEVANTGTRAWVRLFDEVTSNHVYRFRTEGGQEEELTQEEVMTRLRDPDRTVRAAAADALTRGLKEQERVLVFTYNNLLLDKKIDDRLRGYAYPEQSRHLDNELERETVDLVVGLCKERQDMVARYYRVKREIMGLPQLTHIDRYAPLGEAKEEIDYDRSRSLVLESFAAFSPEMAARAQEFFDREWIDAEPRPGKSSGAFCSYVTPDLHPVVLMSYLNKLKDVMTLAHELGHGVHASFSREQTLFNYHGTLPLAELASTFGEQLVFDRLVRDAKPEDRLALYADKIEGSFATVFRQAAMYRFEQRCHRKRREEGELTAEEFGDIWQEELQSMFGDSVRLGDDHRLWWSYVSHFIGVPFYVYAYAFGELLALSLYSRAIEQGQAFAEDYVRLLKLGGSMSPAELMGLIGVDLNSREFWLGGLRAIEEMIDTFESISGH
jgi:oligoendopeptidase F